MFSNFDIRSSSTFDLFSKRSFFYSYIYHNILSNMLWIPKISFRNKIHSLACNINYTWEKSSEKCISMNVYHFHTFNQDYWEAWFNTKEITNYKQ